MSTSTRYPTTNAVGSTGFTNAGNAYASDDSYATAAPGVLSTISSYFGGFDFASYIPSGATINSVTVYCERKFSTTASNASSTLRPYNGTTALASENENTSEPTTDTVYSVNFGALAVADVRSADFRILVGAKRGSGSTGYTYSLDVVYVVVDYTAGAYSLTCDQASFTLTGQTVTLTRALKLATDYASLALSGQDAGLLRALKLTLTYGFFLLSGQAVTLTYTPVEGDYTLTCDYASFTLTGQTVTLTRALKIALDQASYSLSGQAAGLLRGLRLELDYGSFSLSGQDVTLSLGDLTLTCDYASFTLTGGSVVFSYALWEPSTDMITLGTLLTRIQNALGDPNGTTWDRTTTVWPFAVDAIRVFPILRPKTVVQTVEEAGHSFTLPSDFRKVIYVEYPLYQDPPEYLMRKPHLDATFFGEDGFYDVDRDYDTGEDYLMWISDDLAVDDVVSVRYLATHTTDFANEYAYITIENQYVQVIVNHVVLMCYQERLGAQLQDPTAHTSTVQQFAEAVKSAQAVYLASLTRAEEDLSSSQRISGWKVDKHDRIY